MIQHVEEVHSKLEVAALLWPGHREVPHHAQVNVELSGAIDDSRSTVSECRANTVGSDYGRGRETRGVEIIIEFALDRAGRHQVRVAATRCQLSPVFANAKDVGCIVVAYRESRTGLEGKYSRSQPMSKEGACKAL